MGLSSSLILYGILMFIHADILEKKERLASSEIAVDRRREAGDNRDRPTQSQRPTQKEQPTQMERPPSVLMLYLDEQGSSWIPPSPDQTLRLFVRLLDEADVPDIPELRRNLIDEALLSLGGAPLPSDWGEPVEEEESFDLDFSEELEGLREDE